MDDRTDKVTRVLSLYDKLINGQLVDKEMFCIENDVSGRGFDRDIHDIRLYLSESFSGREVLYDKERMCYYIPGSRPRYMDKFEAAVIIDLILSAGAFREDEAFGLSENLLCNLTQSDRKAVLGYLKHDMEEHKSNHDKAIIKVLGDLYSVISAGSDIVLTFFSGERKSEIKVSPVRVYYADGYFYLICAKNCQAGQIEKIRVDKIESFKILKTFYAKNIQNKYEEEKQNGKEGQFSAGNGGRGTGQKSWGAEGKL